MVGWKVIAYCSCAFRNSPITLIVNDTWNDHETGEEEGFYAWVAANYALGALGSEPQETTGIVEFGGASLQVIIIHQVSFDHNFNVFNM